MSTYVCLLYIIHVHRATVHLYYINVPFSQITILCLPITLSFMSTVRYMYTYYIVRMQSTLPCVPTSLPSMPTTVPFMSTTLLPVRLLNYRSCLLHSAHTYCLVHHAYLDCLLHYSAYVLYIKPRM
jgi:hypothetical protein